MLLDNVSIYDAQRRAFDTLISPDALKLFTDANGGASALLQKSKYRVDPKSITVGAVIRQELPFIAATQNYSFSFTSDAPPATAALNNVILGKNTVFVAYALRITLGTGAAGNNRIYRSFGVTVDDDSFYNSNVQMKIEQSVFVDLVPGRAFRDVRQSATEASFTDGMYFLNPLRVIPGDLGTFRVNVNLYNAINLLTISANTFASCELVGAYGQPQG